MSECQAGREEETFRRKRDAFCAREAWTPKKERGREE